MRSAVHKPEVLPASVIKAKVRTDRLGKVPVQAVVPKLSVTKVDSHRQGRAERLIKSASVSHYSRPVAQPRTHAARPVTVSVVSAAKPKPVTSGLHPLVAPASSPLVTDFSRPPRHAAPVAQPATSHAKRSPDLDIFEQALAAASAHEDTYQPHKSKKKRSRGLQVMTASLVALFIVGFLTYSNAEAVSLKIASYRAGVSVTMPAKQPTGFAFSYLDYKPGVVTANFMSPNDGRQYNISQKSSNWDSQALLSNFVASANAAYKTYSRAGRTVYLVGNNMATWVDGGVWYTVDGNSSLSSQQVLDLASSM